MKKPHLLRPITRLLLVITCLTTISLKAQTYYSSFTSPSSGTHYTYAFGGVCIGCGMGNDSNAASLALTDSTSIYMTVGVGNVISARLKLTDTAADLAGVVIASNTGLLNASALGAVVLRTYYAGSLQETFAGGSVLGLSLLTGGRQRIQASTSLKFDEVELIITNAISAIWDIDLFYAFGLTIAPLPVHQYALKANISGKHNIMLNWNLAETEKYQRFHIMHSTNGSGFTEVSSLDATSNRQAGDTFTYIHQELPSGKHYYYIQMEDLEGHTTATGIISQSLSISGPGQVLLRTFPNPAGNRIFIDLPEQVTNLRIFNSMGTLVYEEAGDMGMLAEINIEQLAAGTYLLQVETPDGVTGREFFIKI
jgi:hypothetical protein